MTAQDLKNSILQLAMQGKLVEQRAEEGTAKELIVQIGIEKERLIKEGKIRKEKPLPKIKEEEIPFKIPNSWEWVRWGNLANSIQYGYNAPSTPQGDIRIVRISDIQNNIVNWSTVPYCQISEKEIPMYLLSENDLLFARTGGTVGKSYLVTNLTERAIYAGYLIRSNYNKRLCAKYLKYFMESPLYWSQLKSGITQTAQPNCNGKTLSKMTIPIPPIEEQKRIVEKIDELFSYIERYEKAYSKLEILDKNFSGDMQKSILQYAMQGKLVEQRPEEGTGEELYCQIQAEKEKLIKEGKIKKEKSLPEISRDEMPFDIPVTWKWVRLSEVVDVRDGTHDSPRYYETGIPLVTSKNISGGGLSFDNVKYISKEDAKRINERSNVDTGDILFAMIGSIGNPVIVNKDRDFCVKNVALFKIFSKEKLYVEYLYWFLFLEQFVMQKIASGGVQSFISLKVFRNYLFPLPPYEEQKRIVIELKNVMLYC